uniref:Uncharacterized protein n=1 Tax=Fagus sylvatica TaxID=28930 RepID=A0A2N9GNI6_FAGSY
MLTASSGCHEMGRKLPWGSFWVELVSRRDEFHVELVSPRDEALFLNTSPTVFFREFLAQNGLSGHSGSDEDDEEMDVDAAKEAGEVAQALLVKMHLGELPISQRIELFSSGLGDIYYPSNDLDPYLKDKDDEDSENAEDMTINPTDVVLVWIYEESDDGDPNVYVHHDIIISANPLCTAWLDCPFKGGEKGNFIAVGSMEPSIEIWDLDIIDEVQPCVVLGGIAERKEKKKKVQAVAWNHHAPQVILTGSFDRSIVMKNGRMPEHSGYNYKWSVTNPKAAVVSVSFSEDSPFLLAIGGSKGNLEVWDTLSDAGIQRRFGNYIKQKTPQPSLEDE